MTDNLVLDPAKSRVRLRTFAEGLFARLAHDLELECTSVSGTAERAGDGGVARLEVPIAKITVSGALKGERVDTSALSASDRDDCMSKMQKDVFHTRDEDAMVRVEATLEAGRARVRVTVPSGKTVEHTTSVRVTSEERPSGPPAMRASGKLELSLSAIGSDTVKGPMNAFRIKDHVDVLFDVVFTQA